ncbi:RIO kinase 1 [Nematocida sp. AWRm77]|nr:RIO kinase 1 [Nematocida sp. AWRm77]
MEECNESRKTERRRKDADDIKTTEGVLDNKTREILAKLKKQDILAEIQGAVSVGKEAAIYLAQASPQIYSKMCRARQVGSEESIAVAIKVYKTSAMVFKDRTKYIEGERRFKKYAKRNSRKLIQLWAEKEVRNLNRLQKAGIPSPCPLFLRRNILIMTMIGESETSEAHARGKAYAGESSREESEMEMEEHSTGDAKYEEESEGRSEEDGEENEDGEEECLLDSSCAESSRESSVEMCALEESSEWDSVKTGDESLGEGETDDEEDYDEEDYDEKDYDEGEDEGSKRVSTFCGIAPNLKCAALSFSELEDAYAQIVCLMKRLYRECGLVHADLSEYNLLYWKKIVYVIDVGQSVEFDHPSAQEFLRMDIANITAFFSRQGVRVLPLDVLFAQITSQDIARPNASAKEERIERRVAHTAQNLPHTKEERKTHKKTVKEQNRERRKSKLSKKEKKQLSKKIQISKKR